MTDAFLLLAVFVLYGTLVYLFGLEQGRHDRPVLVDDEMCPNCVTPWQCSGPHQP